MLFTLSLRPDKDHSHLFTAHNFCVGDIFSYFDPSFGFNKLVLHIGLADLLKLGKPVDTVMTQLKQALDTILLSSQDWMIFLCDIEWNGLPHISLAKIPRSNL